MKKILLLAACAAFMFSCTPDDPIVNDNNQEEQETPTPGTEVTYDVDGSAFLKETSSTGLTISVSNNLLKVGVDTAYIVVRYDGKPVASGYKLYETGASTVISLPTAKVKAADGTVYNLPYYLPTAPATKSYWVTYKTLNTKTAPASVVAVDVDLPERVADPQPASVDFVKRAMVLDFTGTGCGWCPYMIASIDDVIDKDGAEYNGRAVVAEVHSYSGNSFCDQATSIASVFGVSSYPTVVIDNQGSIGNSSLDVNKAYLSAALAKAVAESPNAGISAAYALSGDVLLVRMTVKAAKAGSYRAGIWLMEDKIYAKQAKKGDIKPDPEDQFDMHNDVLRIADSEYAKGNYTGHDLGAMEVGECKDYASIINIDPTAIEKKNCHLVFFVMDTISGKVSFSNAVASESLNGSIAFDYK